MSLAKLFNNNGYPIAENYIISFLYINISMVMKEQFLVVIAAMGKNLGLLTPGIPADSGSS